ncbi:membrane protein insertion efficiency factor YidD [Ideonella sp. A 288]|uniref:membrane protein insertion efficiency factor YidD n=1 Tax=Ideonella sp. A 288 TaxID=1962181 RepID=UPI000B4A7B9A
MVRSASIAAIGVYQRHVSPHKGFCCAHRARTGRASCSQFAKRAISRYGFVQGLALLRRRFEACSTSAMALASQEESADGSVVNEPCPIWSKAGASFCGKFSAGSCACLPF